MVWADGFIAVDWGTTNRRGYRIDSSGQCIDEFEDAKGVLTIPAGGFPNAVAEVRERLGDLPLLLAGMIGSNRGWVEAPYVRCPAGIADLAANLAWAGEREAIVPGVSYIAGDRADVMRGEEVQMLGAAAAGMIDPDGLVCHPGTHNKWAILRGCAIQSFRTVMTGELFNLLKEHSVLADLLSGTVEVDDAFRAGTRQGLIESELPAELFSIRARVLLGQASAADAASYASGLLIGTDVRIGLAQAASAQVIIMARPELTRLYAAAIAEAGRQSVEAVGEAIFAAGIRIVEVPLNSPDPIESIRRLAAKFGDAMLVGAGTVLEPAQVAEVGAAGGRLIVSPNTNIAVIAATAAAGLVSCPGYFTPSEAFAAIAAGATALKLFPAEGADPNVLKAQRAVLPQALPVFVVGGVKPGNMAAWIAAGADGFGLGSGLYTPGQSAAETGEKARAYVAGVRG